MMTFEEYQQEALATAFYPAIGSNILYPALGLTGEAGEVANQVKKIQRDDNYIITEKRRETLIDELGDVLWYIAALAHELGATIEEIAEYNVGKLKGRHGR